MLCDRASECSVFQFISKILNGVDARVLCRLVTLLHSI